MKTNICLIFASWNRSWNLRFWQCWNVWTSVLSINYCWICRRITVWSNTKRDSITTEQLQIIFILQIFRFFLSHCIMDHSRWCQLLENLKVFHFCVEIHEIFKTCYQKNLLDKIFQQIFSGYFQSRNNSN